MLIKEIRIKDFKRFHDLEIKDLGRHIRLVVLAGPNGSGKSSLFEAFNTFHRRYFWGVPHDAEYYIKKGAKRLELADNVQIEFFDGELEYQSARAKRAFYIRSAYRNEADFSLENLSRVGPVDATPLIERLIDNDIKVSQNYLRLVSQTLAGVYDGEHDDLSVPQLRDQLIGTLRTSMQRVFGDLILSGTGRPLYGGTFLFEKGQSHDFPYKNLSAGEKAAFDLLLDLLVKRDVFNDSIYCIDEPDTHIGTRVQNRLLREIVDLVPENCQLWIATHSIGMMRAARDIQESCPEQVVFLDFASRDFDQPVIITPAKVDRRFWSSILEVALDDLADLVAPRQVVLCEGEESIQGSRVTPGFDQDCYTKIFGDEFPDTAFISVGNSSEVQGDKLGLGKTVELLIRGTEVIRLIDRDDRSPEEVNELAKEIRVLRRRHLEAYLLDDEILMKLCHQAQQPEKVVEVLAIRQRQLEASVERGNPPDDVKSASRAIVADIKHVLRLTASGSLAHIFMRDQLAPLVTPDTRVYRELREDIFSTPRQQFTPDLVAPDVMGPHLAS